MWDIRRFIVSQHLAFLNKTKPLVCYQFSHHIRDLKYLLRALWAFFPVPILNNPQQGHCVISVDSSTTDSLPIKGISLIFKDTGSFIQDLLLHCEEGFGGPRFDWKFLEEKDSNGNT